MKTILVHRRVASFLTALVVLLLVSPGLGGAPQLGLVMAQGSRVPGMPVPSPEKAKPHNRGVEVTFTKWITTYPFMAGFTGGDVDGDYVGEVLERQVSTNPNLNGIVRLEAIYEVQAGDRSFTALIRGGTNAATGAAILDGVVLAGWRTGAPVHVEFDTKSAATGCAGVPAGVTTCFEGTIHVGRAPKD